MLRYSCEILRPFTQAKVNKSIILRCHSVFKISLGCSCYLGRNTYLQICKNKPFHLGKNELQAFFFKEPKSFIFTTIGLLKEKDNQNNKKNNLNDEDSKKVETTKASEDVPSDEKLSGVIDSTVNAVSKISQNKKLNENISKTPIFGSLDTVENVEISKQNFAPETTNKFIEPANQKADKAEVVELSDDISKSSGCPNQSIPGIESKVTIQNNLVNGNVQKSQKQLISNACVEAEIKREVHKLDLGFVNKDMKLEEPPGICNSETGRASDEVKLLKDATQNLLLEKAKNILRKTSTLKVEENERCVKLVNLGAPKGNINISTTTRRRQTVDLNRSSTERNFITPVRAMTDFLLKPSDLEGLRKTKRRSPYENDPPITVYWRKDVEAKALDVWGSKENLLKEILKRDIERRRYQQNLFTVKRRLRDYRREQGRESEFKVEQNGLFGSSGKVVLTAIAINGTNFLFKLLAWVFTGSHSMFSEAVHSLADTINQLILAYGIHKSVQRADSDHPYGYTNMRYVASLISGVGIFCVGSGLSFYHGFVGLTDPSNIPSFYWAYFILGGSLASEGATLLVAFNSIRVGARKFDMSLTEYILRGQDPSVNVVLLEDTAAVIGVTFAGSCMGLSSYCDSHIPDAIGSFLVGGLLACVASFIIYTNVAALVGRSIPQERLDKINAELESDVMIRAIHDVKGIDIGNSLVRYKAEMDFDGGELTRSYLDKQDLNQMLEEVRKMQTIDELEEFMLKHGENIVDMMGGEIDRIELKLRKKHPEIRHCDLEIL